MGTKRVRSGDPRPSRKAVTPELNNSDYSDDENLMVNEQCEANTSVLLQRDEEPDSAEDINFVDKKESLETPSDANVNDENPSIKHIDSDDANLENSSTHEDYTANATVVVKRSTSDTDTKLSSSNSNHTEEGQPASDQLPNVPIDSPSQPVASTIKTSVTSSPIKTTLSYSQQQAEILQQSPSKRREVVPRVLPKNEPRLVISRLVLTNFKSYAGVQEIGPFHASFSAVVGPNGSGKSNVIDSLLFVFGFRALKMRQAKLSELIHNSSDGEKLGFCQVDIHFQHIIDDPHTDGAYSIVPDSSLVVSRKATRQNQSTYYLDGRHSNYTEVTDFLKNKGIDLEHKRFLILQGEVESIAQMKAKAERDGEDGLLEYLEDIIGTSNYKPLIEENLARVESLNEACLEKENRFRLVETDKDRLEDKKDAALQFLAQQKKLVNTKSIQFQVSISQDSRTLRRNEEEINLLKDDLKAKTEANKEYTAKILEAIAEQDAVKKEIDQVSKKLSQAAEKQRESQRLGVSLEEKVKNYSSKLKKAEKTKSSLLTTAAQARAKLENSETEMAQATSDLAELQANMNIEREKLDGIRTSLTSRTSHLTEKIALLQEQLEPWNIKVKEKDNDISLVSSAIEMLKAEKLSKEQQLANARQRLIDIKKEGKQKETEFSEETEKLRKVIEQINLGEEQCSSERQSLVEKRSRVQNARLKTQDAISSLSLNENKNQVLNSLMRLAKSGRIDGFHGRLGDLGVIDDIYDVAISTACPGLDSMVVETVETAQACIDYLRKNRLGYANFICLNKLRQFNLSPINTPGDPAKVKRLFDLIKPQNPKFGPAFYSKLFNTLVAPNLQEAKKVAYGSKRWKVVTLDGKVVDTSGTMSGGGSYVAKGGMRLTNSHRGGGTEYTQEDVALMQEELAELEAAYDQAESDLRQKEEMLQKLKLIRPETEFAISRLRLDIESLSAEKKEITVVCKTLIAENEDLEAQDKYNAPIAENETRLEALTNERADIKFQMADLEREIQTLQESIMEMGGVELKMQNSKLDSIKQQIEIINDRTSNDKMTSKKLQNEIERHEKLATKAQDEIANLAELLEATKVSREQELLKLDAIEKEVNQLEAVKSDKEEELEALSANLGHHQEIVANFKSSQIELEHKIEKCQSSLRKAEFKINDAKQQLSDLNTLDATPYIYWLDEDEREKYDGAVLQEYTDSELEDMDLEVVNGEVEALERYMATVQVDIEVLKEYGHKKDDFEARRAELNAAVEERDSVRKHCEELRKNRLDEFMNGFNDISMTLKDMYRMITMGGNAELELVDSLDPFSEGILFSVMPPKKSWKNISNLSGGEKTLSSLALVFALHQYKPTPLYVMDEIDAALDFRNVSIVANYIRERTKNAQFIVISLRNNMFELAQQLVGIYKVNDKTKSVSLNNKDFLANE